MEVCMAESVYVIGGVDTHAALHCAAVIDKQGRFLGCREFRANQKGYRELLAWMRRQGEIVGVGVEGTGAYGAGLARFLGAWGVRVFEVARPDRRLRRQAGKSDPIDAEAAARAVLAGKATRPKSADGRIEAMRALRVARNGAVKARTAAVNTLRSLIVAAPEPLRDRLTGCGSQGAIVATCARLRPDLKRLDDPSEATKLALRRVSLRAQALDAECRELDLRLRDLVGAAAPETLRVFAMGPETTAALLVCLGDNPDRLRSEAAFARLCGVAPIPASSGNTRRHRLHRGGNRSANRALHIAVVVRMRYCERTRAYVARRTAEGLSKPEIIRCLKRYLAREVFRSLQADYIATMRA